MVRPIDPAADFLRMAELYSLYEPEPVTVETLQEWLRHASPERIHHRFAAVDQQGWLIGFNNTGRDPWDTPGRFWIEVVVDPAWSKQGIGSLLYTDALDFARSQGATILEAEVRDNLPESLRFCQQRGFRIDRHIFESTLALATFDESRFDGVIEQAEASGIRFASLADFNDSLEARRKLYEINRRYGFDIPGRQGTFPPFEAFSQQVFEASWYRADAEIVAIDGETWVGLSAAGYFSDTNSMYNMITGVEPAYRNRRIALALKLLIIKRARVYGAAYLRTNNDSENTPMLAVNRKLGYQPEPGKYLLVQNVASMNEEA